MSYAKSLRVIGQTLEAAQVLAFELEKRGPRYVIRIASTNSPGDRPLQKKISSGVNDIGNGVFCFTSGDISRLDAQAQKRRRNQSSSPARLAKMLSHQLRVLGDYLERIEVSGFRIVWSSDLIVLDYQKPGGQRIRRIFTPDELRQQVLHRSLLRSNHNIFPWLDV